MGFRNSHRFSPHYDTITMASTYAGGQVKRRTQCLCRRIFFFTIIIAVTPTDSLCYGQVRFNEFGSAESYNQAARTRRDENWAKYQEEQWKAKRLEEWRSAKKLSLLKELPAELHQEEECLDLKRLKDKSAGYLDYFQTVVLQVLGQEDALLVLDNRSLATVKRKSTTLWLKGYPTGDLVDGEQVRLVGYVQADGTKSYKNSFGVSTTVRVIRFSTPEEIKKIESDIEAERQQAEAVLYRTWSDSSGKFSLVAKFIKYQNGKVHLQRKSGSTVEVSLSKLCKKDQKWVRKEVKIQRSKKVD